MNGLSNIGDSKAPIVFSERASRCFATMRANRNAIMAATGCDGPTAVSYLLEASDCVRVKRAAERIAKASESSITTVVRGTFAKHGLDQ